MRSWTSLHQLQTTNLLRYYTSTSITLPHTTVNYRQYKSKQISYLWSPRMTHLASPAYAWTSRCSDAVRAGHSAGTKPNNATGSTRFLPAPWNCQKYTGGLYTDISKQFTHNKNFYNFYTWFHKICLTANQSRYDNVLEHTTKFKIPDEPPKLLYRAQEQAVWFKIPLIYFYMTSSITEIWIQ